MKKLTSLQIELLATVRHNPGCCTAELRRIRGDRQIYDTNLRDRLFCLMRAGVVRCMECVVNGTVVQRRWYPF